MLRTHPVLSEICGFVGVEYSEAMLDYQVDAPQYPPPDPSLVAQWKTKLSPREVAMVEVRTGGLLASRGYRQERSSTPDDRPTEARTRSWTGARLRRLRTRVDTFGPTAVAIDVLGRRLGIGSLARQGQRRINAVEQRLIDEEAEGTRAPSANIAPIGRPRGEDRE